MAFERRPLGVALGERGYIRGPFGSALVRSELTDQGVPVYEQQHAIAGTRDFRFFVGPEKFKELSRFQVRLNDLIISCSGTVGKISVIREGDPLGIISQALLILRPQTDLITPEFLYYFLSTQEGQDSLLQASHGSVQVNIAPRGVVEQIPVPVATLDEQRAVVRVLSAFDRKIELNRRMGETLEAIARALFRSWFVDFDPVRAKVAGRKTGLPEPIDALFPDSFVDSELGEIPKGWRLGTVGAELLVTMGQSPPGETYNEAGDGIPFFQGRTDFGFRYPTRRVFCTAPTRFAEVGDTLVSVRAPVGDVNLASERCCVGRGVASVRHRSGAASFAFYLMRSLQDVFGQFEAEGTVFGSIGRQDFDNIPCVVPPPIVVERAEAILNGFDRRIALADRERVSLEAARSVLLPKLVSGELRTEG